MGTGRNSPTCELQNALKIKQNGQELSEFVAKTCRFMGKTCHGYDYISYFSFSPHPGIGITSIRANFSHLKAYCKYDTKYHLELPEHDEKAAFDAGTILHQTMKDLKLKDPLRAGLMMRRLHGI